MNNTNGLVTGIVMVLIFVAGFGLGHMTNNPENGDNERDGMMEGFFGSSTDDDSSDTASQSTSKVESPTTIDASAMTDGQRKMLQSLGVDTDSITVTPEMMACAESSLGNERIDAIQNGDTPSFLEGTKLMTCYTAG